MTFQRLHTTRSLSLSVRDGRQISLLILIDFKGISIPHDIAQICSVLEAKFGAIPKVIDLLSVSAFSKNKVYASLRDIFDFWQIFPFYTPGRFFRRYKIETLVGNGLIF